MNSKTKLALYVHIPFCRSKCIYCDFASYPNRENLWETYLDTLLDEIRSGRKMLADYEIATIFIGGGTPSLLPIRMLQRILDTVHECASVCQDAEITMEANPGTLSPDKLKHCRRMGINRISFGAQSMNDNLLKDLGRIHTSEDIRRAVQEAREAGFDDLSLDLMYALPNQTMRDWMQTLDEAVKLSPEHLSAYSLIVEEGTPLFERVHGGRITVPDDDLAIDMQRAAVETLSQAGYDRYEISNYARIGHACRHNMVYWQRGNYWGVGCAAHSLLKETRFENPRSLEAYLSGKRRRNIVHLNRQDQMEETLMLSTRTCQGMNLEEYRRKFRADFVKAHEKKLIQLQKLGLVEYDSRYLRLTTHGMEVQNAVVVELLDD